MNIKKHYVVIKLRPQYFKTIRYKIAETILLTDSKYENIKIRVMII